MIRSTLYGWKVGFVGMFTLWCGYVYAYGMDVRGRDPNSTLCDARAVVRALMKLNSTRLMQEIDED